MSACSIAAIGCALLLTLCPAGLAAETADVAELRRQLDAQRALIQRQQQQIDQQMRELERMERRLNELTGSGAVSVPAGTTAAATEEAAKPAAPSADTAKRDDVGDLNREAVLTGDFPGSFRIPGPGNVSLRIGGFVKAVGIADSRAEAMGADFLPATLGTKRADRDGAFSLDATITRLHLDGRAPTDGGGLRGYVEADLNQANDGSLGLKLRHAYGTWTTSVGTLTVGHTWSTLMDLQVLPEGLTEPTVSGPIFMRQPQIRWSQPLGAKWTLHAAIEDPSSNDVFSDQPALGQTSVPDGVAGIEFNQPMVGHLRLNGILRNIEVDLPDGGDDSALGWGLALSGHLNLLAKDRLRFSGVYGQGLGRYLLGIQSTDGSAVDPVSNQLRLRDNWGVQASYEHHWSDRWRSNAMLGYAASDPFTWQSAGTLGSTTYGAVNLMWQVLPYLTLGVEYDYGKRENKDGSDLDNHRVMFGVQVY